MYNLGNLVAISLLGLIGDPFNKMGLVFTLVGRAQKAEQFKTSDFFREK